MPEVDREPQHSELLNGRIDTANVRKLARHFDEIASADEYFVCGPGNMVEAVRDALDGLNGKAPIRFERFAGAAPRPTAPTLGLSHDYK